MVDLATTNVLLGIMAGVSVLEALLIVGLGIAGWRAYGRVMQLTADLEQRHVAPLVMRINTVLDDVKAVSTTVKAETERVDYALHRTMDRVDDTAHRVQANVRAKTSRLVGFVLGVRTAIEHFAQARDTTGRQRTGHV